MGNEGMWRWDADILSFLAEGNVLQLMEEVCSSEGEERLTAELLQKLSQLSYAITRGAADLPDLPAACPANVRYTNLSV